MKILVVCQYYYPEPFRITDICEGLVERGHEVHVVTGYPNYPEGQIYPGYGKGKKIDEIINGVKIHRCFTIPRKTGIVYRLLNYFSYTISAAKYVQSNKCTADDGTKFDVVFCNQLSPVMMAQAAVSYKKKAKVPAVMYCLDLWPESLTAGGIKKDSFVFKVFHKISKDLYRKMDRILITSRNFSKYLVGEFAIKDDLIKYLPQYAESLFEQIEPKKEDGQFDFMFAGNIGEIQGVEVILKAAEFLKNEAVNFHIVGNGTDLQRLEKIKEEKNLSNVIFHGRKPLEEMPNYYAKADAMLVTLKADPVISLTLPGKVQSYMAVGKPIIGAIDGETQDIIAEAECGYCGAAENEKELVENIKKFISNPKRNEMGINARRYYEENFEKELFMSLLEKELYENSSL